MSKTELAELWRRIARMRKANGDKEGARQAYRNARAYEGHTKAATLCSTLSMRRHNRAI